MLMKVKEANKRIESDFLFKLNLDDSEQILKRSVVFFFIFNI